MSIKLSVVFLYYPFNSYRICCDILFYLDIGNFKFSFIFINLAIFINFY